MKARSAGLLLLPVLMVLCIGHGGSASATHLGFKRCQNSELRHLRITDMQSNFGCRRARRALRTLLAHGVRGLPKPTATVGRWGCRNTGVARFHSCERRRSDAQGAAAVVFAARRSGT